MTAAVAITHANDDQSERVRVDLIHKIPDHNPRRIRSRKSRAEIRESIREKGVIQPVLLRPHPTIAGEFQLVAGETRLDLAMEVGLDTIPALIREMDDIEAKELAASENIFRENMTLMDEGEAARRMMEDTGSDKEAVCRALGWNKKELEGRLQLTFCIKAVGQALCDGDIHLGHAQYLSGLRPESQVTGLEMVLKEKMSVADLRSKIESLSMILKRATFNTEECQACPHNSTRQSSLFGSEVESGRCLNRPCFEHKTDQALYEMKAELSESFQRVELDRDLASGATRQIVPTGSQGVGREQMRDCRECEHYGAVISTRVGSEGAVERHTCFYPTCHESKVSSYQDIIATDATVKGDKPKAATAAGGAKKSAGKAPQVATTPRAVVEHHHQVHRKAGASVVSANPVYTKAVAVLAMLSDSGISLKDKESGWPLSLTGEKRAEALSILCRKSAEQLDQMLTDIAAQTVESAKAFGAGQAPDQDTFGSMAVVFAREADLSAFYLMDSVYLKMYTKPVIDKLLSESGFKAHYEQAKGDGAFKKLMGEKKDTILDAVKASDYDFQGYLPGSLLLKKGRQD